MYISLNWAHVNTTEFEALTEYSVITSKLCEQQYKVKRMTQGILE